MPSLKSFLGYAACFVGLAAFAFADDWSNLATVSMTNATTPKLTNRYACYTDGRDIRCDNPSLYITTGGLVGINTSNPQTELEVNGTISATNFVGDGSGLTGVVASTGDRIVSGTNGATRMVAISSTGYISITQAGANSGWFDPTRGLVTLGVSSTGPISGTAGYFSGPVGIGTATPETALSVNGNGGFNSSLNFSPYAGSGPISAQLRNVITETGGGGVRRTLSGMDFVVGSSSAASYQGYLTFSTTPAAGALTERMRVSTNGNVGIGTQSPAATLQVNGSLIVSTSAQTTTPSLYVGSNGDVGLGTNAPGVSLDIYRPGTNAYLRVIAAGSNSDGVVVGVAGSGEASVGAMGSNKPLRFVTSSTERVRIDGGGNVGIGTNSPVARLDVAGTISASDAIQVGQSTLSCASGISGSIRYSTTSDTLQVCTGSGWKSLVSGTAGAGTLSGSGSATAVAFWNGASALSYDTDGFYWDATNNRLGVGTNAPGFPIEVSQSSNGQLDIAMINTSTGGSSSADFYAYAGGNQALFGIRAPAHSLGQQAYVFVPQAIPMAFYTSGVERLRVAAGGNVGIGGIVTPTATLQVSGSLIVSTSTQTTTPSLYVGTNGNVGIGTSGPSVTLSILGAGSGGTTLDVGAGSASNAIVEVGEGATGNHYALVDLTGDSTYPDFGLRLLRDNTGANASSLLYHRGTGAVGIHAYEAAPIVFRNSHIERMRVAADGKIGIGTATPTAVLTVSGTISASDAIQVGQSTLSCASGVSGSIRYSATSGTIQVCNGTGWVSLSSGTSAGVAALASLTDVNLTNIAGRDYLRYDAGSSKWVNISESTVMSTTTMLSGWPDAIRCKASNGTWNTFYLDQGPETVYSGWNYRSPYGSSSYDILVQFNSAGNYNTATNTTFDATQGCNKSIAQLYAAGQAFNFIGSANVTGTTALGDRITSGTTTLTTISNTGYVSLTQGGANTAWFDPTRGLVTIGVSSTGPISGTSGYFSGNVGIGVTSPGAKLHTSVTGGNNTALIQTVTSGNAILQLNNSGGNDFQLYADRILNQTVFRNMFGNDMVFKTGDVSRVTIASGGNVGISTSSPVAKLDVNGTISASDAIQVSGSTLTCNSGLKGSIRYSNTSSTLEYCNSTAWTSLGPSDTLPVSFMATRGGTNQAISADTFTKVQFNTEEFDNNNNFDSTTNYRFQPTVRGRYLITGSILMNGSGSDGGSIIASIYKNGARYKDAFNRRSSINADGVVVSAVIDFNGTTDYVELYAYNESSAVAISGLAYGTYFSGSILGPQAGGSGGSATPAGSTGDIQYNNAGALAADTGQLFWDATNNRLGIGTNIPVTALEVSGAVYARGPQWNNGVIIGANGASGAWRFGACDAAGNSECPAHGAVIHQDSVGTRLAFAQSGNLGVGGVVTPTATLQVSGTFTVSTTSRAATSPSLYVGADGKVGIGTSSPQDDFTVYGTNGMSFNNGLGNSYRYRIVPSLDQQYLDMGYWVSGAWYPPAYAAPTIRLRFDGNVGIRTFSPTATLDVNGTISASDAIQVSGSSLTCSSGLKGAIRYSNTSSTLEYCNSTAWTSLGPSDTSPVSFSVHKNNTAQTVATNSWVKLTWSTEVFDTNNNFASDRFTPTVRGKYIVTLNAFCSDATTQCIATIYKNGANVAQHNEKGGPAHVASVVTIVDMNGSSDYLEGYVYNGGGTTIDGAAPVTYFAGSLLGPQASGGGGGATPAGSTGDIQYNSGGALSADTGQLYWDATNNRLGIGTGAPTEGLTSIVSGSSANPLSVANGNNTAFAQVVYNGNNRIFSAGVGNSAAPLSLANKFFIYDSTSATVRLAIDTNGNMGLGTVTPAASFEISQSVAGIRLRGAGGYFDINADNSASNGLRVFEGNNVRWQLVNGKTGISKTTPVATLDVGGTISASDAVQVGASSLTCGSGLKGAIRYSNTSNTLEYCNSQSWASLGPSPTALPYLRLSYSGSLARSNVVPFSVAESGGGASWSSNRFTAAVPGVYVITSGGDSVGTYNHSVSIRKNGSDMVVPWSANSTTTKSGTATAAVTSFLNAGDYIDFYFYHDDGSKTLTSAYASVAYISTGSSSSGGSATPAGSTGDIQFNNAGALAADTGQLYWDASNNRLGIGTNAPAYALDVNGYVNAIGFPQSSDRRLKDNIVPFGEGLAVIEKLNPVSFKWKANGRTAKGFIAQDVEQVAPGIVFTDGKGMKSIDFAQMMPFVVNGMKELKAANDNLRHENDELVRRLDVLERKVGGMR